MRYTRSQKFADDYAGILGFLILIGGLLAAIYGWVHNIVLLFSANELSFKVALRIVGILVAPVGVILGYRD